MPRSDSVIPAQAGIQDASTRSWTSAFAGVTTKKRRALKLPQSRGFRTADFLFSMGGSFVSMNAVEGDSRWEKPDRVDDL